MQIAAVLFTISLFGSSALAGQTTTSIPDSERRALVALYQATTWANWKSNANWLGAAGTEASWYGIEISDGHVTSVELDRNNLAGSLPSELADLSELKKLRMRGNVLIGFIPSALGKLAKLEVLGLEVNQLTGSIPPELGRLGSLRSLYLYANRLSGGLPAELGDLVNLNVL